MPNTPGWSNTPSDHPARIVVEGVAAHEQIVEMGAPAPKKKQAANKARTSAENK